MQDYLLDGFGEQKLTLVEKDQCRNKEFRNEFSLTILGNSPPIVTNSINTQVVYQGQDEFSIDIPQDLFVDHDDTIQLISQGCIDRSQSVLVSKFSSINLESTELNMQLHKEYVGTCETIVIAYDSLFQPAKTQFNVLAVK